MQILRLTQPEATAQLLAPYLLEDTDYDKNTMLQQIMYHLDRLPDNIQILAAIDKESFLGFTIAIAEPDTKHTFLLQAWVSNLAPAGLSKKLFSRVIMWSEDLGRVSIRMETKRNERGFTRRFKFQPFSTIMEHPIGTFGELEEDPSVEVRSSPPTIQQELYNGQEIQSEEHDAGDYGHTERSGELLGTEGGDGGESLRRFDDSGPSARDVGYSESTPDSGLEPGFSPAKSRPVTILERGTISNVE